MDFQRAQITKEELEDKSLSTVYQYFMILIMGSQWAQFSYYKGLNEENK